jgi:hypothetical protein
MEWAGKTEMSPSQRVVELLNEHAGSAYCDDCVRKLLRISRVHVNERQMTRIAIDSGLSRQPGRCLECGTERIVAKAF